MRTALRGILWSCIPAAAALAQNVTVPALLQGVEGGGSTGLPFSSNLACRMQCVYDAQELPWTGPRVITGISLRADNNVPNTSIAAKGFIEISVLMSTTDKNAANLSTTFAENYGLDATWVLNYHRLQFPAQPALPAGPRPCNIDLVFTTPWVYGLTPARGPGAPPSSLLVELWVHSQPSGAYRLDTPSGCSAPTAVFGLVGPLCADPTSPGNQGQPSPSPLALTHDASMTAGSQFAWHVAYAAASAPFLVAVNLTNQGGLFGNPAWALPYPMFDPANPALPSAALANLRWPAPDCWLNIDPVTTFLGVAGSGGTGSVITSLPAGRNMVGQTFHGQAVALAPTVNALQLVTSAGRSATVCGPLGASRVYAQYNNTANPPPPPPATGTTQLGVALVFEVR